MEKKKLRIKLRRDLPVERQHGANVGREFDVLRVDRKGKYWFLGDTGREVAAWGDEVTVIKAT